MKHGSLFSGIGGFDLAAEWMGWENVFHCEINPFGQKILKHYWPNAILMGDIKKFRIEFLWQEFVQNARNPIALQKDHIANSAIAGEHKFGENPTEIATEKILLNGAEERNLKFSSIMEARVFVAENLKWNFSRLTIREIMEMKNEGFINLKHGNLLLNEDFLMTIKSYALTAIMQELITAFAHILQKYDVDVISAGFPCQPFSAAGKRKGTDDDRHLWPETIRVIREFQPVYVVGENVRGLTNWNGGLVFDQVQADLEAEGYEVLPFLLPACAVGAPHRRERIWFVAYASGNGHQRRGFEKNRQTEGAGPGIKEEWKWIWNDSEGNEPEGATSNAISIRQSGSRWSEYTIRSEAGPGWKTNNVINVGEWPIESPVCGGDDGLSGELDGITFSDFSKESHAGYGNAIAPKLAYQIFKAIELT